MELIRFARQSRIRNLSDFALCDRDRSDNIISWRTTAKAVTKAFSRRVFTHGITARSSSDTVNVTISILLAFIIRPFFPSSYNFVTDSFALSFYAAYSTSLSAGNPNTVVTLWTVTRFAERLDMRVPLRLITRGRQRDEGSSIARCADVSRLPTWSDKGAQSDTNVRRG